MKKLFLLFIIYSAGTSCQSPGTSLKEAVPSMHHLDSLENEETEEANRLMCTCVDTPIVNHPGQKFPFNVATKILAYEFKGYSTPDGRSWRIPPDSAILAGKSWKNNVVTKKILNAEQVYTLEKIFFNRIEKCNNGRWATADDCIYDPHHGFVFLNEHGKAVSFVEICFICEHYKSFPKDSFKPFCGDIYCDIRNFYKSLGFDSTALQLDHCPGYNFN